MRHLRFSLFDLFIITLGVATGLAYYRAPGVSWSEALLVMCAGWIVVGMVQHARSAYRTWRSIPRDDRELRNGALLALTRPIAVVLLFAAAVGLEVVKELEVDMSGAFALDAFTSSLFSLAILGAYIAPGRVAIAKPTARKSIVQTGIALAALFLSCFWLVYTLVSAQMISGLVHIAIRGVDNAQPTRWYGRPFHPYDPQTRLYAAFFWGAFGATAAVATAAISTVLLTAKWNAEATRRLLIGAAAASIAVAACGALWYWTVGFPAVSPLLAMNTGTQPWYVLVGGISVFAGACFLFAMRYGPEPRLSDSRVPETVRPYHLSVGVLVLLLLAIVASAIPLLWSVGLWGALWDPLTFIEELQAWWDGGAGLWQLPQLLWQIVYQLAEQWIDQPKMILRMAAALVVIYQLRRWRRGESNVESLAPVQMAKLVTLTALAALTLAVAIPTGAWLGFAIVTTPIGGY